MTTARRAGRYAAFKAFFDSVEDRIMRIAKADKRHSAFDASHKLYVAAGGRNGALDNRLVEVFYGSRPLASYARIEVSDQTGIPQKYMRAISEHGASLIYQRLPNGRVACVLYPATTESLRPTESAIVLAKHLEPSRLDSSDWVVNAHWNSFIAYMQCTCVDGDPSWRDWARVTTLRLFKPMIFDRHVQDPAVWRGLRRALFWAFTVGLSGSVLAFVQLLFATRK